MTHINASLLVATSSGCSNYSGSKGGSQEKYLAHGEGRGERLGLSHPELWPRSRLLPAPQRMNIHRLPAQTTRTTSHFQPHLRIITGTGLKAWEQARRVLLTCPTLSFVFCPALAVDCRLRRTPPETVLYKTFTDLNNRSDRNIHGSAVSLHLLSTSNTKHLLSSELQVTLTPLVSMTEGPQIRVSCKLLLESLVEGLRRRVNVL